MTTRHAIKVPSMQRKMAAKHEQHHTTARIFITTWRTCGVAAAAAASSSLSLLASSAALSDCFALVCIEVGTLSVSFFFVPYRSPLRITCFALRARSALPPK